MRFESLLGSTLQRPTLGPRAGTTFTPAQRILQGRDGWEKQYAHKTLLPLPNSQAVMPESCSTLRMGKALMHKLNTDMNTRVERAS